MTTPATLNGHIPFHNQQQGMMISQTLQYNAPNYAPQLSICFGTCPSGTMQTTAGRTRGYLDVEYRIPAAQQRSFHQHPNVWHNGVHRLAYLPDTAEGRNMLLRFQYAFLNGLCFEVGQSIASGLDDQVRWSPALPHRTGTTGGPQRFSFPDRAYLPNTSRDLDQLRIPQDPLVCRQWILQNQPSLSVAAQMNFGALGAMTGSIRQWMNTTGSSNNEMLYYDANRSSLTGNSAHRYSQYLEPVLTCNVAGDDQECPICLDEMVPTSIADTTNVVCIKTCQHHFHKDCIMEMFDRKHNRCPTCVQPSGIEPYGQGPSGSMKITINPRSRCEGFDHNSDGVIEMYYKMESGTQLAFMENPGQRYSGTSRITYLPHNESGRKLLARLKYAFTHGLTFRVGTSVTTGSLNQVTWTSIHHKTSVGRGAHGFPDPNYFDNCNESLDALSVPKTENCT